LGLSESCLCLFCCVSGGALGSHHVFYQLVHYNMSLASGMERQISRHALHSRYGQLLSLLQSLHFVGSPAACSLLRGEGKIGEGQSFWSLRNLGAICVPHRASLVQAALRPARSSGWAACPSTTR
jgi:hypothetical protein